MNIACVVSGCALLALAGAASGQVNGQYKPAYGAAWAVQSSPTGFGDSNLGQVGPANGSELDGGFAYISGVNLNVLLTGNLESNFNKLEIFVDNGSGGQNQLRGDNAGVDFNGLNRMAGLHFDNSFSATHWIGFTGDGTNWYANGAVLLPGGGGPGDYLGTTGPGGPGVLSGGNNFMNLSITVDNSNVLGVTGTSAAGALTALSGVELQIPLASLGLSPASVFRLAAFVNGGGHDFVSNQVLGGLANGTPNLGDPSFVDFRQYAGDQFFTVPGPGATVLLGLAGLAAMRRRR
jgi:hypothetical protein